MHKTLIAASLAAGMLFHPTPTLASNEVTGNVFRGSFSGVTLTKASSWFFLTQDDFIDEVSGAHIKNAQVKAAIGRAGTYPTVVALKYDPASFTSDLNPSLTVRYQPGSAGATSPVETLEYTVPYMEMSSRDYKTLQAPVEVKVGIEKAGYMRAQYTAELQSGQLVPAISEGWVFHKGGDQYVVTAIYRQDERNGSAKEIHKLISTLKIGQHLLPAQ